MKLLLQPPALLHYLFPGICWHFSRKEKVLYLTFDDGPDPEVTPGILDLLKAYSAKATFFCIGKNVEANGELFRRILQEGHRTGNHTWSHLNAWKTSRSRYIADISRASQLIHSDLFRPPYGRITPLLLWRLKKQYRIVLWDVISYDWKAEFTDEDVWSIIEKDTRPGSILVFHDSQKAAVRVLPVLEQLLSYYSDRGYRFEAIS